MIQGNVLVLNRHFQPIHVTSVKRAFSLLYLGVAKAIDRHFEVFDFDSWAALSAEYGGSDIIQTTSRIIRIPRVIILQMYERIPRSKVRFSRYNIYTRDDNTCQYCSRKLPRSELNLDHVVPRSHGGKTTWENVVCSCISCNLKKGGRTPDQARMKLVRAPNRPRWTPTFRAPKGDHRYRDWLPFLSLVDASYWNVELDE